jgi:hypothetical protein
MFLLLASETEVLLVGSLNQNKGVHEGFHRCIKV